MLQITIMGLLVVSHVAAEDIKPDWKVLTDFTAQYEFDMKNVIAIASQTPNGMAIPFTSGTESGTIHADILGERLWIRSHGALTVAKPEKSSGRDCEYKDQCHFGEYCAGPFHDVPQPPDDGWQPPPQRVGSCKVCTAETDPWDCFTEGIPPQLLGSNVHGNGEFVFDGPGGFVEMRAHVVGVPGAMPMPFTEEFCVRVKFPQGLVPPPPAVDATIKQGLKAGFAQAMRHAPPHNDVTIDGESVSVFEGWCPAMQDRTYVGIRHNGAPFGAGFVPPKDGEWTPLIKFPSWKHGAGDIEGFPCNPSASTSAADLIANPQAALMLGVFDKLVATLSDTQPVD